MHLSGLSVLLWVGFVSALAVNKKYEAACKQIGQTISNSSNVYYDVLGLNKEYNDAIDHYASSSTQKSACAVVPGSVEDVSKILKVIGQTRTPFAVKSGGHNMNPGFSSSPGIMIAMSRFNKNVYNPNAQTAEIGPGQTWSKVYSDLEPYNVTAIGGRTPSVGVGGFTLGGGYSWLTNERGLAVDSVVGFNLVKPDGSVAYVTNESDPDLFFSLKGGHNNYGIVTSFVVKVYPQGPTYGGIILYGADKTAQINALVADFAAKNQDPKCNLILAYTSLSLVTLPSVLLFYNGAKPAIDPFASFLAVPSVVKDVSTRSYSSLVNAGSADVTKGVNGRYQSVPIETASLGVLNQMSNQSQQFSNLFSPNGPLFGSEIFMTWASEPFLQNIETHASSPSAYPGQRTGRATLPFNLYVGWTNPLNSDRIVKALLEAGKVIVAQAKSEGQNLDGRSLYTNYADASTPVENLFGTEHLAAMRKVKARVDPNNVMSLAGGFKI